MLVRFLNGKLIIIGIIINILLVIAALVPILALHAWLMLYRTGENHHPEKWIDKKK